MLDTRVCFLSSSNSHLCPLFLFPGQIPCRCSWCRLSSILSLSQPASTIRGGTAHYRPGGWLSPLREEEENDTRAGYRLILPCCLSLPLPLSLFWFSSSLSSTGGWLFVAPGCRVEEITRRSRLQANCACLSPLPILFSFSSSSSSFFPVLWEIYIKTRGQINDVSRCPIGIIWGGGSPPLLVLLQSPVLGALDDLILSSSWFKGCLLWLSFNKNKNIMSWKPLPPLQNLRNSVKVDKVTLLCDFEVTVANCSPF